MKSVQEEFLDLFLAMGSAWVLYVLLGLSVVSLAIACERVLHFWQRRDDVGQLLTELETQLGAGQVAEAQVLLRKRRSYAAEVVATGLSALSRGPAAVEEVMTGASLRARLQMERGVAFLGTLGNNAPFIGLFGTVLGIIRAFRDLAQNSVAGSSAVMAGIAESLVATAVGLLVALPAVALFNGFQRRIRVQLVTVDALSRVVLAHAKTARS